MWKWFSWKHCPSVFNGRKLLRTTHLCLRWQILFWRWGEWFFQARTGVFVFVQMWACECIHALADTKLDRWPIVSHVTDWLVLLSEVTEFKHFVTMVLLKAVPSPLFLCPCVVYISIILCNDWFCCMPSAIGNPSSAGLYIYLFVGITGAHVSVRSTWTEQQMFIGFIFKKKQEHFIFISCNCYYTLKWLCLLESKWKAYR